jgi:hypothetical protein
MRRNQSLLQLLVQICGSSKLLYVHWDAEICISLNMSIFLRLRCILYTVEAKISVKNGPSY